MTCRCMWMGPYGPCDDCRPRAVNVPQPIAMCWRALVYGQWVIVSNRMAAALILLSDGVVKVRLTCLDLNCDDCDDCASSTFDHAVR